MRTALHKLLLALGLAAASVVAAEPTTPAPFPSREERLVQLARLWGQVRYRHPYLAYKDINWDAALVAAIPRVEAATERAAYAAALQSLLTPLGDPVTRVLRSEETLEPSSAPAPRPRAFKSWEGRDVLVLDLRAAETNVELLALRERPEALRSDLARARSVIIDLRGRGLPPQRASLADQALGMVLPLLLDKELTVPGPRMVAHWGYRSQSGVPSGYYTALLASAGEVLPAQGRGRARKLVLLLDEDSTLDARVLAMQARGLAQLVSEGRLRDESLVEQMRLELGGGVTAQLRLSELALPVRAEVEVARRTPPVARDMALQAALKLARKPAPRKAKARASELPAARWRPDRKYEQMLYPSREYRLLALFRLWNVIHLFYPYKHLLDRSWDEALPLYLPKFEGARDAAEYALAVAELCTLIQDGHTHVRGHPELAKRGLEGAYAPFVLMDIEGKAVVVEVRDAEAAPGIAVGQVVESVDGRPLEERIQELSPYVTASHEVHRRFRLLARALSGPEGSQGAVAVREASGQVKEVRFTRSMQSFMKRPAGDSYRVLEGDIGYVDMRRLQVAEVAPMFERLKDTRAIVFDMRGYPNGTAWAIAPYLNTRGARFGAVFERSLISGEPFDYSRYQFFQDIPKAQVPLYRGRTVMLIDERAISQSEHTGLFFEAANGTTFIGSPSAGANGDVTDLVLPGGMTVLFSGHDVRHADGRLLQRVGLQPYYSVRPTVAGLQAGRDEVLEQALRFLERADK